MKRLTGKIALITGAAAGIGRAAAGAFAREGATLVLTDINEDAVVQLAKDLSDAGAPAIGMKHDVRDEAAWRSVMERTASTCGRLDVLVNNAGIGRGKPLLETSLDDWRTVISINLDAVFLGCRLGVEAMRATPDAPRNASGSIINISSALGLVGKAKAAPYCASKGGVRLLTKAIALEAAANDWNIRVNSVHPGYIDTPMVEQSVERLMGQSGGQAGEIRQALIDAHPMGRLGNPDEIANTLLFLASDESAFMTGSEMVVDGGYTSV